MVKLIAFVALVVVGCGAENGVSEMSAPLTGNWQIGYQNGWAGWMDVNEAMPSGDFGGLYVCLTASEGYVHGDLVGHRDGEHVTLHIHDADIEADVVGEALAGTAMVAGQPFAFHGHR